MSRAIMRYYVETQGHAHRVDIDADDLSVDGSSVDADLRPLGAGLWHLLLDGRSYTISTRKGSERGGWELGVDGSRFDLVVLDERRRAIRRLSGIAAAATGPQEVVAPMPGLVVAVEVSEGDAVAEGQGLAVIEAMKMENELKAKSAGRIKEIRIEAGQTVDKGDTLLVLEPDAAGSESGTDGGG